jgi:hypothetical protein
MPYVTGKRYRVWWGVGLDWTRMQVDLDGTWTADDPITHFTIPYVEQRAGGFPIKTKNLSGGSWVTQPKNTAVGGAADTSGLNLQNDEL